MGDTTSKRILIADDEQYIRELYQEVLVAEGYDVDIAKDGKEAYDKIIEGGYHLIALDVIMPQMDGLSILEQLQNHKPKKANGPIILLTSLINDPAVREASEKGVSKIVYKTEVNPEQFVKIVSTLMSNLPAKKAAEPEAKHSSPKSEPKAE